MPAATPTAPPAGGAPFVGTYPPAGAAAGATPLLILPGHGGTTAGWHGYVEALAGTRPPRRPAAREGRAALSSTAARRRPSDRCCRA